MPKIEIPDDLAKALTVQPEFRIDRMSRNQIGAKVLREGLDARKKQRKAKP